MINVVVEGQSDTGAVRRIVEAAGRSIGHVQVARGKTNLDPKIPNYSMAARRTPWVVFRDSDSKCPVELRERLTAQIERWEPGFMLRIAHSMTEAWLLADRDSFGEYFKVSPDKVPGDPEALPNAKQTLLQLCGQSRSRNIREEVVAASGEAGILYVHHLNEFAVDQWDVESAAENSESLRRAIDRIRELPAL